ncbi:MAG: LysM peptidoglycan-binding domain-containing protein, partial [Bacteroidales bacterium]
MYQKELKRIVLNFLRPFNFQTLIVKVVFVLLLPCTSGWSQVVVERSKEKVVIEGVPYYLHQVRKGETPYSISRAYGITTDVLTKENPSIKEGLKEGQSLRIPARLVSDVPLSQPVPVQMRPRDEGRFIYHILQGGETIYSLSKRYNVSENDIIQSNPGIDIYKISTGYELAIPRKVIPVQKQSPVPQDSKAYFHKVVKGETMNSISRQYGITVRELRRENRDTRFPQVGDYLRIPGMKTPEKPPVGIVAPDSAEVVESEVELYLGKPSEYTPVTNLGGSLNVAVLLPFYLNENTIRNEVDSSLYQRGKRVYTAINRTGDWIYPGTTGFLEMYEGILLAADTLRSQGLDINLH